MTHAMNRENVQKLLDVLVQLQAAGRAERFDMANYFSRPVKRGYRESWGGIALGMRVLPARQRAANPYRCGTAACLMGWASLLALEENFTFDYEVLGYKASSTKELLKLPPFVVGMCWLGLAETTAHNWAYGHWKHFRSRSMEHTLQDAIDFLRLVLESNSPLVKLPSDNNPGTVRNAP